MLKVSVESTETGKRAYLEVKVDDEDWWMNTLQGLSLLSLLSA